MVGSDLHRARFLLNSLKDAVLFSSVSPCSARLVVRSSNAQLLAPDHYLVRACRIHAAESKSACRLLLHLDARAFACACSGCPWGWGGSFLQEACTAAEIPCGEVLVCQNRTVKVCTQVESLRAGVHDCAVLRATDHASGYSREIVQTAWCLRPKTRG